MIDPPRLAELYPVFQQSDGSHQWLAATEPTVPVVETVDTLRTAQGSLALGVCHILNETDKGRIAWRLYEIFHQPMRNLAGQLVARSSHFTGLDPEEFSETAARELALFILRSHKRPETLPWLFQKEFAYLKELTTAHQLSRDDDRLFSTSRRRPSDNWLLAALIASLIADKAVLAAANVAFVTRTETRQQLRLRSLQGGFLVDFWGGQTGKEASVPPAQRGALSPAAELFGLGCTIGNFTEAEVKSWLRRPNDSMDMICVMVAHNGTGRQRKFVSLNGTGLKRTDMAGYLDPTEQPKKYNNGIALITAKEITDGALGLSGSSNLPNAPKRAFVNYELTQTWVDPDALQQQGVAPSGGQGPSLNYGTGDGRIEVLIEPADIVFDASGNNRNTVVAFNVYGIWEGASAATDAWFQPGAPEPSLEDLKPWRITRRYSFERDLKGALPDISGKAHPSIYAVLADPPWQPLLQRVASVQNLTDARKVAADAADTLPYETNKTPDGKALTTWAFDLRTGMTAGQDNPHGLPINWDPCFPPDLTWQPERWRNENSPGNHSAPQRYRFWVTAVDCMEQESVPLPVATEDCDAGENPNKIFSPRRRTQLPRPPQDSDAGGDVAGEDRLAIAVPTDRSRIDVRFSAPRQFSLGTQQLGGAPAERVDSKILEGHVLLLKRRLIRRVNDTLGVSFATPATFSSIDPAFDWPLWQVMLDDLDAKQGWKRTNSAKTVLPPSSGEDWTCSFPLSYEDRGFEYCVVVGFVVSKAAEPFWMPAVANRTVQKTQKSTSSGNYELIREKTSEAPGISSLALSSPVSVPNRAHSRGAQIDPNDTAHASTLLPAKPILPPPNVNRDLVLMRLLANSVAADKSHVERIFDAGLTLVSRLSIAVK